MKKPSMGVEQANEIIAKYKRGDLFLNHLTQAHGLMLPMEITGGLYLNGLRARDSQYLKLPRRILDNLSINSLQSLEGIVWPDYIGGNLYVGSMRPNSDITAKNLSNFVTPFKISGDIYLGSGLIVNPESKSKKKIPLPTPHPTSQIFFQF